MLRRKIETQLEAWRSAPKRTALLVTGARQIGKTYIIRHFAQQHYDHIAELNFIENPDLVALFDRPRDAKNLLMRLELAVNTPLVPGKTLIFFDEVQRCKEMVTAIKFLVDDGRFDYALSGSPLGVELEDIRSVPVGYRAGYVSTGFPRVLLVAAYRQRRIQHACRMLCQAPGSG